MITLIQNDYETPILFHTLCRGKTVPLVGSKVLFDFVSKETNRRIGGGECEVLDSESGLAKYKFADGELAQVGEYQGKITVDLTQGARREGLALDFKIVAQPAQK